jgi:hypothetical protein
MPPEFLNVDLDLESAVPLTELIEGLGTRIDVLHHGPLNRVAHYAALEIGEGRADDPDSIINAFCKRIEALKPAAKRLWRDCAARRFDIGILSAVQGTRKSDGLRLDLQPATLKRVAALSAQIVITIYPKESGGKKE